MGEAPGGHNCRLTCALGDKLVALLADSYPNATFITHDHSMSATTRPIPWASHQRLVRNLTASSTWRRCLCCWLRRRSGRWAAYGAKGRTADQFGKSYRPPYQLAAISKSGAEIKESRTMPCATQTNGRVLPRAPRDPEASVRPAQPRLESSPKRRGQRSFLSAGSLADNLALDERGLKPAVAERLCAASGPAGERRDCAGSPNCLPDVPKRQAIQDFSAC